MTLPSLRRTLRRTLRGRSRSAVSLLMGLLVLALGACGAEVHDDHHDDNHHQERRLTIWDGALEAFALFEVHDDDGDVEGVLYLAYEGRPLGQAGDQVGWLELAVGGDAQRTSLQLHEPGKAEFELSLGEADRGELRLGVALDGEEWELALGTVDRHEDLAATAAPVLGDLRTYHKESQWLLPFAVEEAVFRPVDRVIRGSGRLEADPRFAVTISAPVAGEVATSAGGPLPVAGARLVAGDGLLELAPNLAAEGSWVSERIAYSQARDALERAQRLRESDAISQVEYQERERAYEVRRAGYEALTVSLSQSGVHVEDLGDHLRLTVARGGVVRRLHATPGRQVSRGDPLVELHDPERLSLEAFVHLDELDELGPIQAVELTAGRDRWTTFQGGDLQLLGTQGATAGAGTRVRITFGLSGAGALRAGQPVHVVLRSPGSDEGVAVPRSAIFDEHSHKVVFVQHHGDQFERRVVEVGALAGEWASILSGLTPGERVVVQGTYPLHLATAEVELDHSHDH